jgi:hypothetical protein
MRETDELHRVCRPTSAGAIQAKPDDTDIEMRSLHEDGETVENTVRSSEGAEGELIPFRRARASLRGTYRLDSDRRKRRSFSFKRLDPEQPLSERFVPRLS